MKRLLSMLSVLMNDETRVQGVGVTPFGLGASLLMLYPHKQGVGGDQKAEKPADNGSFQI